MPADKITRSLYGGEVTLHFYPERHWYKLDGEKTYLVSVTGATGIIDKSRPLIYWAVGLAGAHLRKYLETIAGEKITPEELYPVIDEALRQHEIKKEAAGSVGEQVHRWIEEFTKFKTGQSLLAPEITDDLPAEVINGINAFLDWFNSNDVQFLDSEILLYSKKHIYAGFADAIAIVNKRKLLIDYKTGSAIYPEAHFQAAGYVLAYEEETGERLDGTLILNFGKESGELNDKREISRDDVEKDIEVFLHCLAIKKREKELNKLNYK